MKKAILSICGLMVLPGLTGIEVASAVSYLESPTLSTGWYGVNLSTGILSRETVSGSLQIAASSGPAAGIPYADIDWIGMGRNNHFPSAPRGVYMTADGKLVDVHFSAGSSVTYTATQTVGGTPYASIDWIGTTQDNFPSDPGNQYGIYLNSSGQFTYVTLETGATFTTIGLETASGTAFSDINWMGIYSPLNATVVDPFPVATGNEVNRFYGTYLNSNGSFTTVDLVTGAETVLGATAIASNTLAQTGGLVDTPLSSLPFIDVSSIGGQLPRGTIYIVNVPIPEPSVAAMGVLAACAALNRRRRVA